MIERHTDRVARSFARSFDSYGREATQQAWIADHLISRLGNASARQSFERGLELGCGTGHLTRAMTAHFSFGALTINDLVADARLVAADCGATFLHGDALETAWPNAPDLVISASMIQWLSDPAKLMRRIARDLAPGGWLAVSGYGLKQFTELVELGSTAQAPGLCPVADLVRAVSEDLDVIDAGEATRVSYFASPRDALRHLRQTGVNGRAHKGWTKGRLLEFSDAYQRQFQTEDGIPLTYNPTWIIARKPG